MNLPEAKARADLGIERAAAKTHRVDPAWIEEAIGDLRAALHFNVLPFNFTIEDARFHCRDLPPGCDGRVWGHITRQAVKLGIIEATGQYAPAASSNGSPKMLYRRGKK